MSYSHQRAFISPVGTSARQYTCRQCGARFVSPSELESHLSLHPIENLLRCKHCGMYFRLEMKLKVHVKKHELQVEALSSFNPGDSQKNEVQESLSPTNPQESEQREVQESSDRKAVSRKRVKAKLESVSYNCSYCDKVFKNQNRHEQHERKHTGELAFKCSYCEKSFRIPSQRRMHERFHTGERPFSCDQCSKSYVSATKLRYHQQSHHDLQKRYKCSYCESTFTMQMEVIVIEEVF